MSSIKLEEGKFYRSRNGEKVGPLSFDPDSETYPWDDMASGNCWTSGGKFIRGGADSGADLVAEWTDEKPKANCVYGNEDCETCPRAEPEIDPLSVEFSPIYFGGEPTGINRDPNPLWRGAGSAPERVRILNDGAALTNGDRDDEYGPPANNMTCAGELKATFRKWLARDISPGELEALDMAMTKLSRLACGKPKRDTYVDAATYIAIAGEVALKA